MEASERPRLRLLETVAIEEPGRAGIIFIDPEGLSPDEIFVPQGLLAVVACFTGERSIAEIATHLSVQHRQPVETADVSRVADELAERLLLEGERVTAARAKRVEEFDQLSVRPATHAGSAGYPGEPEECRRRLDKILNGVATPDPRRLVGLIAPHIDLERGRKGYACAYGALSGAPPADVYVIFGTGHQCPKAPLVPIAKDFATPLGVVPTDRDFVAAIAAACPESVSWEEEILHLREHSVEFQVLFLKHCLGDRPFRIVPFLTGRLPMDPGSDAGVRHLIEAFTTEVARRPDQRIAFVAGADMAHLGPRFGDSERIHTEQLGRLSKMDRQSLDLLADGRAEEFFVHVEGDGNTRRVCGTVPMYLVACLSRAVEPGCVAEILDYGQAVAPDASQVVSFGAVQYRADGSSA